MLRPIKVALTTQVMPTKLLISLMHPSKSKKLLLSLHQLKRNPLKLSRSLKTLLHHNHLNKDAMLMRDYMVTAVSSNSSPNLHNHNNRREEMLMRKCVSVARKLCKA